MHSGETAHVQLRSQPLHEALVAAQHQEPSTFYRIAYHQRAGIEGTISQGVSAFGLRRSRYIGLSKTYLQHVLTATAINLCRLDDWLNKQLMAKTRQSTFVRLMSRKKMTN